jgi:hypothetical protein
MTNKGILIIANKKQEWIIPWWWYNYRKFNVLEVSFLNCGMSKKALHWCEKKGRVITLDKESIVFSKKEVNKANQKRWETANGKQIWEKRKIWFLKPFALLKTPYDETFYMDLDCEVKMNVEPLFSYCRHKSGFSCAYEMDFFQKYYQKEKEILPKEKVINTGVIIYKKNCSFLQFFAQEALARHHEFFGDQNLFQRLIFEKSIPFNPLPAEYNFISHLKLDSTNASIVHWGGSSGKETIKSQIELLSSLSFINWDTF